MAGDPELLEELVGTLQSMGVEGTIGFAGWLLARAFPLKFMGLHMPIITINTYMALACLVLQMVTYIVAGLTMKDLEGLLNPEVAGGVGSFGASFAIVLACVLWHCSCIWLSW